MKKLSFLFIAMMLLIMAKNPVTAQDISGDKDFKFTIKTNPLSALGGPLWVLIVPLTSEYKVYFEAQTTARQSIQIGAGYLASSPLLTNIGDIGGDTSLTCNGFRGQLWYKFFLTSDNAPGGFYIGPHVSYAAAKLQVKPKTGDFFQASKLNVHVVFGYQIVSKGGFALDIFTGLGFKNKKFDTSDFSTGETFEDLDLDTKSGVSVPLGLAFGYAF